MKSQHPASDNPRVQAPQQQGGGTATTTKPNQREIYIQDYISKIRLLETQVGTITSYAILSPFAVRINDAVDRQRASKRIAEFVGLGNVIFLISPANLRSNQAGQIELDASRGEVVIEISDSVLLSCEAFLATLAHEITHKYLELHGLSFPNSYENEAFTDIAAVFLGLGKLLLNGCESTHTISTGISTTMATYHCGYLTLDQLSFVYRLVCAMRGITDQRIYEGLSGPATGSVKGIEHEYSRFFLGLHHSDEAVTESVERCYDAITEIQRLLATIEKHQAYLSDVVVRPTDLYLRDLHCRLRGHLASLKNARSEEFDPCMRYLDTLRSGELASNLLADTQTIRYQATQFKNNWVRLTRKIHEVCSCLPERKGASRRVFACWVDGTKIPHPLKPGMTILECPACHYSSLADTSPVIPEPSLARRALNYLGRYLQRERFPRNTCCKQSADLPI